MSPIKMNRSERPGAGPLNPALLGTFLAVAEHGGVLPASRHLHLSQPAVTARIRQLEDSLGTALFLRSARGMSLTPAGRRLSVHAREVRRLLRQAAEDVAATAASDALTLAASTTLAAHVLPPLLARFHARHPLSALEVSVGNTDQVLARVREGLAPLGMVEGRGKASAVRLTPLLVDEIVPVYAPWPDRPELLAAVRAVRSLGDLMRLPVIWREEGSGTRKVVAAALARAGVSRERLQPRFVLGETESIKAAVRAGMGIGFLSRCTMDRELQAGELLPIAVPRFRIERTFWWALPAGGLPALAARFHAFVTRELGPASRPRWTSAENPAKLPHFPTRS